MILSFISLVRHFTRSWINTEYKVGIIKKRRRDTMFDQVAYFIFEALVILTVLVVVVGIPLGDTLLRKK